MKFCAEKLYFAAVVAGLLVGGEAFAAGKMLSPQNFNKMYWLATKGKIGILREAVNRGLNIDSVNPNGDTGLCIAIKRNDYIAYNSFRMSGANTRHPCTYKIYKEYQAFLESNKTVHADAIVGNEESLYYNVSDRNWTPWILGGLGVAGAAIALGSGGGGGSGGGHVAEEVKPVYMGLTSYQNNYGRLVSEGSAENSAVIDGRNPEGANVVNKISFLPDMLDNAAYLKTAVKAVNGASFVNNEGGKIELSNAAVGLAANGQNSVVSNNGSIVIEAQNGAIGMAASNNAKAYNGLNTGVSGATSDSGSIRMVFQGSKEGNAVIGMYGDTTAEIVNAGKISGTAASGLEYPDSGDNAGSNDETAAPVPSSANSGTMLGMGLFDFYAGTDLSNSTSKAQNNGRIDLSAGYNNASGVSISLIGMGSYIDNNFLEGKNNPAFAEKMKLVNSGDINLSYQGQYSLASAALKNGEGGLVGMRADAMSEAVNQGDIKIDMQATQISSGADAAAGMLAVHGGEVINGVAGAGYDGTTEDLKGTIRVINEATSGGVYYGMLAAKGSGKQTGLYNWKTPKLSNYGVIDMQVSNAYGMASFTGAELVNEGVILVGVEKGQSYYTNNYGLYAAGGDKAEQGSLVNKGVIRVNSKNSTAIYNAYTGAVEMKNEGNIYLSNKATGSGVFGGNYSKATNSGSILYAAGNSENLTFPPQVSEPGAYVALGDCTPKSTVIGVSLDSDTTKRLFENEEGGLIEIGKVQIGEDYGGTYSTVGVKVSNQAGAVNRGDIHLVKFNDKQGQFNVAMWLDGSATAESYLTNKGTITIDSISSGGMLSEAISNTNVVNNGKIVVNGKNSYGIAAGVPETNVYNGVSGSGTTTSGEIYVGNSAYGMAIVGEKVEPDEEDLAEKKKSYGYNYGTIYLQGNGASAFYIPYAATGIVAVQGNIVGASGYSNMSAYLLGKGKMSFDEAGTDVLKGYSLARVLDGGSVQFNEDAMVTLNGENSGLFIADGKGAEALNLGTVEVLDGAAALKSINGGSVENAGNIVIAQGIGLKAESGTAVNTGEINVINGTGVSVDGGEVENTGRIRILEGVGAEVNGEGRFVNAKGGEIEVLNGEAVRVEGKNALAANEGAITLSQNSSVYVGNRGTFANNGTIVYNKADGETAGVSQKIQVNGSGWFINNGVVDFSNEALDFGEKENFVLGGNGTYKALSFSGNVAVDKDMIMAGFEDVYSNKGAFEGDTDGLSVSSQSYMYDVSVTANGDDTTDVEAKRKDFGDLVEEKDLAEFFEMNYKLQNNEKMYHALKAAEDKKNFDYAVKKESGKDFYANLARENMAVLRGVNMLEQKRVLEDGLEGGSVGMAYFRTGKDANGDLSGYADDVYNPYISYGKKLNKNWSVGGTFSAVYADSDYDEANSERENKILMALMPVMYQNGGFKFLSMPGVGVGFSDYKRRAISGVYEADTTDFYYGMYNHGEYSVDMKVAELVAEAELNLQGASLSKAKEDEGLRLRSSDMLSLESGVGLKLRKRFALAKERSLMLALGVKYYHEFLDPYEDLTVGMKGSPVHYKVKGYDEDKNRLRTTAEAVYKDGDFSVAAEIAHNAEKESNLEGGVGVRYNF
ncbi:MAG: hypothetical protein J6C85_07370 [Alphaproteobacteria bacterium]|nr:hypothetical protein [Alphaproteobacteria bacterium]